MSYDESKFTNLGQLKDAMEETQGRIAAVASAAAEAIEELIPESVSMTIPTTGWSTDSENTVYPKYYDFAVSGITANNRADVIISISSMKTASDCGLCPTNETIAGYIRLRAMNVPSAAITAVALVL